MTAAGSESTTGGQRGVSDVGSTIAANRRDSGDFSEAATATENTPLLRSDAGSTSSRTLRDGSPPPHPTAPVPAAGDAGEGAETGGNVVIGPWRTFAIIMSMWSLIFLQASNMSGMTMTQSVIAVELEAYEDAMWFTSAYLITTASLAPLVGKLATIFSPGGMVLVSSIFFGLGALVASQAHTFATFITGRVLIGAGGAGIMTLSLILVIQLVSKRRRGLFVGLVNAGFTIGLSTGAVVFGALLPVTGWRALFYLQAPIGLLGGLGVWLSLPHFGKSETSKDQKTVWQKLAQIDYAGAVTMTSSIVLFLYGFSGTIRILPILLSLCLLALFVAIEYLVAADPIIPLTVLQSRGILFSCLSQLGFMAARWTILFYAPIFVLAVRGMSAAVAGSVLIPTNLGFGLGGLIVGWLHVRRAGSFWLPCIVSLTLFGLCLLATSLVSNAATPAWLYVGVIFLNGLCTGAALNYTLAHLLHLAHSDTQFVAASLLATFRGFAGSFGTAIGGGVFGRTLSGELAEGFAELDGGLLPERAELIKKLIGSPALVFGGELSDAERAVAVAGYEVSLKILYRLAAALTVLVVVAQAGTGWAAPASPVEEEEIRETFAEADGTMEA